MLCYVILYYINYITLIMSYNITFVIFIILY